MNKNTILIIEDDEMLRESTADYLVEEGYVIHEAANGLDGIQKAFEVIPDLILCDIAMPKLDGYQVYRTLQENSSTSHIPFIYLTAKTEKEDIRAGMQLGADDYITKPFDYDELQAAINTRLEKYYKLISRFRENFQALMENPLVGVFILIDGKILFHNNKFLKILGYDSQQIKEIDFTELLQKDDKEKFNKSMTKYEKGIINKLHFDLHIKDAQGKYIEVEFSGGITELKGEKGILASIVQKQNDHTPGVFINRESLNNLNHSIDLILRKKDFISDELARKLAENFHQKEEIKKTNNMDNLTKRETEVLQYICKGMTNTEIAENLFVSVRTVDTHRAHLLEKTNSKNTAQLIIYAVKNGFIEVQV